jgi:ribonuclease D
MHKVRRRRQIGVVRELWLARDHAARERDISPGRVLTDAAIVTAALESPPNVHALAALPGFGHRMGRRQLEQWQAAIDRARALPERDLPQPAAAYTGPPPPRAWADKDPTAAARLSAARAAVSALAEELNLPQENLISPDTVRRLCWAPPTDLSPEVLASTLTALGARPWQTALITPLLPAALTADPAPSNPE